MFRAVVVLAILIGVSVACGSDLQTLTGSGDRVSRTFDLDAFSKIEVSNAFETSVEVDPNGAQTVVVEIDDNLVDRLDVNVSGDRLHIGLEDSVRVRVDDPPTAEITVNDLEELAASGASDVAVEGAPAEQFEVRASGASSVSLAITVGELTGGISGASNLAAGGIDGTEVDLGVSGASHVTLVGAVDRFQLDVSGASRVEAQNLSAVTAELQASGASEIRARVSGSADADASGASNIVISGDALIDASTSGSSSIDRE